MLQYTQNGSLLGAVERERVEIIFEETRAKKERRKPFPAHSMRQPIP